MILAEQFRNKHGPCNLIHVLILQQLLLAPGGITFVILLHLRGILQVNLFSFGNLPFGIMLIFLNNILCKINSLSNLLSFDKSLV